MSRTAQKADVIFAVLAAAIIGGGMPVFIKLGVRSVSPLYFSFLRLLIASLTLLPFFLLRQGRRPATQSRRPLGILLLAGLGNIGNVALFSFGIRHTSPALSQILYLVSPILVYLGSVIFLSDVIRFRSIAGIALGIAGAAYAIASRSELRAELPGIILVGLAVLSYSFFAFLSRPLHEHFNSLEQTISMAMLGAPVLFMLALLDPAEQIRAPWLMPGSEWLSLLYVGVLGGAIYYSIIQHIIRHNSSLAATSVLYLQPITAMLWSALILGEEITTPLLLGGLSAIGGAWLTASGSREIEKK